MSQYIISIIRTWVPTAVGWLLGKSLVVGVILPDDTSTNLKTAITALVIALYYAVARWLETKFPNAGVLLGYIRQPVYVDPKQTAPEQRAEVDVAVETVAKEPDPHDSLDSDHATSGSETYEAVSGNRDNPQPGADEDGFGGDAPEPLH